MAWEPHHQEEKTIRGPRIRWWTVALALIFVGAVGVWLVPDQRSDSERIEGGGVPVGTTSKPTAQGNPESRATGTSGRGEPGAASESHEAGAVLTELDTITGANDGNSLVGRRVDLHVDVQDTANDVAFWVGSADNRVLVVMARDNRTERQRQHGVGAAHGIAPVHSGQRATISGVIQRAPHAEAMVSWNLTDEDKRELAERRIYIRADDVSTEGHGTF